MKEDREVAGRSLSSCTHAVAALGCHTHSGAFMFCGQNPLRAISARLERHGSRHFSFFGGDCMKDEQLHALGPGAGKAGLWLDGSQSHGGGGDCQGRPHHRPGLAHSVTGEPHAERQRPGRLHEDRPRALPCMLRLEPCCHSWEAAPLHRGHSGGRHRPCGGRVIRPQSAGGREGPGAS